MSSTCGQTLLHEYKNTHCDTTHHICWAVFSRTNLRFGYGKMHFNCKHSLIPPDDKSLTGTTACDGDEDTTVCPQSPLQWLRRWRRRRRRLSHGTSTGLQVRTIAVLHYRQILMTLLTGLMYQLAIKTSPTSNFSLCCYRSSSHVASIVSKYTFTPGVKISFSRTLRQW